MLNSEISPHVVRPARILGADTFATAVSLVVLLLGFMVLPNPFWGFVVFILCQATMAALTLKDPHFIRVISTLFLCKRTKNMCPVKGRNHYAA